MLFRFKGQSQQVPDKKDSRKDGISQHYLPIRVFLRVTRTFRRAGLALTCFGDETFDFFDVEGFSDLPVPSSFGRFEDGLDGPGLGSSVGFRFLVFVLA